MKVIVTLSDIITIKLNPILNSKEIQAIYKKCEELKWI